METLLTVPPPALTSLIPVMVAAPVAPQSEPREADTETGIRPSDNSMIGTVNRTQLLAQLDTITKTERVLKPYGIEMLPPRNQTAEVA